MVKQRKESARAYEEGGRLELAEKEWAEIVIIEEFLPRQLSEQEVEQAIADAIAASGANSIRDMGKVMGCLLYTSPSPRDRTRSRMPSSA